jgi:hypothetical protein
VLLVGLLLTSAAGATGQVKDLLNRLLGEAEQGGRIENVDSTVAGDGSVTLSITFAEVLAPEEVTVSARVLDYKLRRLDGFTVDPASLTASDGVAETVLRYSGQGEVKSLSVEVRLERSGNVIAREILALPKIWGQDSGAIEPQEGSEPPAEPTADVAQREPQEILIEAVPLGDTPTGAATGGDGSPPILTAPIPPDTSTAPITPTTPAAPRLIPVYSWWSSANTDHLATSDPGWTGKSGSTKGGYRFYRREGYLYAPDGQQPQNTMALYRWYNAARKDHFTTTNPAWRGKPGQTKSGYRFVRLEGYVASGAGSGRVPFKSYWSPSRTDNVATTDSAWNQPQRRNPDYREYRVDGYLMTNAKGLATVLKPGIAQVELKPGIAQAEPKPNIVSTLPPKALMPAVGAARLIPVYSWWSSANTDHLATSDPGWAGKSGSTKGAYRFYRREGYIYAPDGKQPPNTMALYRWYNAARKDHFTTTNPAWQGKPGQTKSGYRFVRLEGYVASGAGSGRVPFKSYWSPSRTDNVATTDSAWNQPQRRNPDYREYRVDGYLMTRANSQ